MTNHTKERACRWCGCTENDPCFPSCHWVKRDLCSQCVGKDTLMRLLKAATHGCRELDALIYEQLGARVMRSETTGCTWRYFDHGTRRWYAMRHFTTRIENALELFDPKIMVQILRYESGRVSVGCGGGANAPIQRPRYPTIPLALCVAAGERGFYQ